MLATIIVALLLLLVLFKPEKPGDFTSSFFFNFLRGIADFFREITSNREIVFVFKCAAAFILSVALLAMLAGPNPSCGRKLDQTPATTTEKIITTADKGLDIYNTWKNK